MAGQDRKATQGKPPITRHPLFPAIVALWFGALFGLGSLAVRPALIESLVLSAHIDAVIPAMAPPLGMTSRILLALILAAIGAAAGGMIARRLTRPKSEGRERRRMASRATPEVSPSTFDNSNDGRPQPATTLGSKRRALAIEEEEIPLELREYAPLPGGQPQILNVKDVDLEPRRAAPVPDPVYAPAFAPVQQPETQRQEFVPQEFDPAPAEVPHQVLPLAPVEAPRQEFAPPPASPPAAQTEAPESAHSNPVRALSLPPMEVQEIRPIDFSQPFVAPSQMEPAIVPPSFEPPADLGGRIFAAPVPQAFDAPLSNGYEAPAAQFFEASAPAAAPQAEPAPFSPGLASLANQPVSAPSIKDLADLSSVQLIERLALSLQRRRQGQAAASMPAVATVQAPAAAPEPLPATFAAPAMPQAFAPPPAGLPRFGEAPKATEEASAPPVRPIPAGLRPISFDHDHDHEDAQPIFVPQRHIAMPAAEPVPAVSPEPAVLAAPPIPQAYAPEQESPAADITAEPESDDLDEESRALEDGYSSLLDLSRQNAPRQAFVRIEEPEVSGEAPEPVVVFPGQALPTEFNSNPASQHRPFSAPVPQAFASEPQEAPALPEPGVRRFDTPPAAEAGSDSAAAPAAKPDSEETERALRAALANLQRMSGAA